MAKKDTINVFPKTMACRRSGIDMSERSWRKCFLVWNPKGDEQNWTFGAYDTTQKADYFSRNSRVGETSLKVWFYPRFSHENARRPTTGSFMIPIMTDFGHPMFFGKVSLLSFMPFTKVEMPKLNAYGFWGHGEVNGTFPGLKKGFRKVFLEEMAYEVGYMPKDFSWRVEREICKRKRRDCGKLSDDEFEMEFTITAMNPAGIFFVYDFLLTWHPPIQAWRDRAIHQIKIEMRPYYG